ncbi:PIN domain-containing protein [Allokutzneria sp. A3M-2-11 16]|uniref:PIN domain-containing protein n=1 Tax=Allokutzneria sp. A3M-2-11 16 TaxID=2962043 RepID=UPI0020B735C3|nr:PIN domain-containing protein [Allokutzneria sp. A3M-2-11 16]MCP3797726.1 PIN domain-containing protein [Allokutzneria sp. A3M-2-11 16]
MAFPVFLDACVLVPIRLADLLLRLAEAGTYRALWSNEVLDEVERNLPKLGVSPEKAAIRIGHMRREFPDAMITGYEDLVPAMTNDHKDRHVLAAAIRGDAAVLVTANLADFPSSALAPYDIDAMHPDDFLLDQLDLHPISTLRCLLEQISAHRNPAVSADEFLTRFARTVPRFVRAVRSGSHFPR